MYFAGTFVVSCPTMGISNSIMTLGHHDEAGKQHDPQYKHHGVGAEEIQIFEQAHFDDRLFIKPFPDDE